MSWDFELQLFTRDYFFDIICCLGLSTERLLWLFLFIYFFVGEAGDGLALECLARSSVLASLSGYFRLLLLGWRNLRACCCFYDVGGE